jgi:hypothetical protein
LNWIENHRIMSSDDAPSDFILGIVARQAVQIAETGLRFESYPMRNSGMITGIHEVYRIFDAHFAA